MIDQPEILVSHKEKISESQALALCKAWDKEISSKLDIDFSKDLSLAYPCSSIWQQVPVSKSQLLDLVAEMDLQSSIDIDLLQDFGLAYPAVTQTPIFYQYVTTYGLRRC